MYTPEAPSNRKLLLFDLSVGGHHAAYIQHLLNYWCQQELSGKLDILVLPKFLQQHSDVVNIAISNPQKNINFIAITEAEVVALKPRNNSANRAIRSFQEWHLLQKYAAAIDATHCLVMYFDTCDYPLMLGASLPCPFSGIYFKPTFHYRNFANYQPSRKATLQEWREKFALSRILQNRQLRTLFCLDPFVSSYIDKFHSQVKALHLPDPVQISHSSEFNLHQFRESLGIDPDRQVFLLFGSLTDRRKGVRQLLEAVEILPPELCQKLCLLFVGEADPIERAPLEFQIAKLRQSLPIQIVTHYEFVPETDVHAYFHLSDVILAPYQKHIGMSGILLLAAATQKPVLSSNYGLMGEIVQRYSLGIAVDSTDKNEIAQGLTRFLTESPDNLGDEVKMAAFATENSADKFAQKIFEHL